MNEKQTNNNLHNDNKSNISMHQELTQPSETEKLITAHGIRYVIKNYIIPEELWVRIINEEFVCLEDEKDICTLNNIQYYQNKLKKNNVVK